jgi:cytochrome c
MTGAERRGAVRTVLLCGLLAAAPVAAQPQPEAAADLAHGEALWAKCKACHTIEPAGRNGVGPRLHGIFGRAAGAEPGYNYSPAMRNAGLVWTAQTLDAYLAATQDFLPGTKMYGGLALDQDRTDLLAWMRQVAGPP